MGCFDVLRGAVLCCVLLFFYVQGTCWTSRQAR